MKERPILFSAPMVRAILDGRKTQTRRVIKGRGIWSVEQSSEAIKWPGYQDEAGEWQWTPCPYGDRGERLWVRESFWNGTNCYTAASGEAVSYWTDKVQYLEERSDPGPWSEPYGMNVPWMVKRPSIHMPRRLSRITLEITGVRVERLKEISEADAQAEGVRRIELSPGPDFGESHGIPMRGHPATSDYVIAFQQLWESINSPGSWAANPWVWVVEFRRVDT